MALAARDGIPWDLAARTLTPRPWCGWGWSDEGKLGRRGGVRADQAMTRQNRAYEPRAVSRRQRRTNAELAQVDAAIVAAVQADRPVTLRGVFYRVVSAGAIPKTEKGYQVIKRQLLKLRRDGVVSYADITDGSRWTFKPKTWTSVDQMLDDASVSYRRALWHDCYVYQLGDHDPSGVDAWRAFQERVEDFLHEWGGSIWQVNFERLAVTPEQIDSMGLLTRPTKPSDTRSADFDGESVEVDAIPASELRRIVREAIEQHIPREALESERRIEKSERETFLRLRESI